MTHPLFRSILTALLETCPPKHVTGSIVRFADEEGLRKSINILLRGQVQRKYISNQCSFCLFVCFDIHLSFCVCDQYRVTGLQISMALTNQIQTLFTRILS
jgi:hypothetical protein